MRCEILDHVIEIEKKNVTCQETCEECPYVNNDLYFPRKKVDGIPDDTSPLDISYEEIIDVAKKGSWQIKVSPVRDILTMIEEAGNG